MPSEPFDSPTEYGSGNSDSFSTSASVSVSISDTGMVVHSHLSPEKSRRIYVSDTPSVNWDAPASQESPQGGLSGASERDPFVVVPDLSEEEFMARLSGEGARASSPSPVQLSRPSVRSGPWRLPEAPQFPQQEYAEESTRLP
ncbi:MAG: hypothetical protein Q4G03_06790, partial [Planctomycetia bacterium]|nr:hypothetical protein [Planctomycetia bacterium]